MSDEEACWCLQKTMMTCPKLISIYCPSFATGWCKIGSRIFIYARLRRGTSKWIENWRILGISCISLKAHGRGDFLIFCGLVCRSAKCKHLQYLSVNLRQLVPCVHPSFGADLSLSFVNVSLDTLYMLVYPEFCFLFFAILSASPLRS